MTFCVCCRLKLRPWLQQVSDCPFPVNCPLLLLQRCSCCCLFAVCATRNSRSLYVQNRYGPRTSVPFCRTRTTYNTTFLMEPTVPQLVRASHLRNVATHLSCGTVSLTDDPACTAVATHCRPLAQADTVYIQVNAHV